MPDVLVIGAGLAGLECARALARAGVSHEVWDAADAVGGRVRTDMIDGFRCDRGFQVLSPGYPAIRRHVDADALALRRFARGVGLRDDDGLRSLRVADPTDLLAAARAVGAGPRALLGLARWFAPALLPPRRWLRGDDRALGDAWDRAGVPGTVRERVLEPFLRGVVLDDPAVASDQFVKLVMRSMLLSGSGLPAQGMAALPHWLADRLPAPVLLGTRVRAVTSRGADWVVEADGAATTARAVVFAVDPPAAAALTGLRVPPMHGCITDWFAAAERPAGGRLVCVDARPAATPVVNTAVVSDVAPSYAPAGRHLVQATCLWRTGAPPSVADVRHHAASILAADPSGWEHVTRHEIPHALPALPAPLQVRRDVSLGDGRFVCGDHRDTASIQGAMTSGRRTGESVVAWLRR